MGLKLADTRSHGSSAACQASASCSTHTLMPSSSSSFSHKLFKHKHVLSHTCPPVVVSHVHKHRLHSHVFPATSCRSNRCCEGQRIVFSEHAFLHVNRGKPLGSWGFETSREICCSFPSPPLTQFSLSALTVHVLKLRFPSIGLY